MNETLKNATKGILKSLLARCTKEQQMMFRRMYSPKKLEIPINDAVDQMDENKMDRAMDQCEMTVKKNLAKKE